MIRPAQEKDDPAIASLWNGMIKNTLATFTDVTKSASDIAELRQMPSSPCLVYVDAHAVLGFARFGSFRTGPGYAATCEHSVVVADQAHGKGVGTELMRALMAEAKAEGIHVMVAAISSANPGAQRFHARLGFVDVGRMPEVGRKAGQWLDLVLMQKILGAAD
ncbi:MAG: N-acetyltransferase family protein [Pseudomonadota bacterium]